MLPVTAGKGDNGRFSMLQLSMVYADADAGVARNLGEYLERNCLVAIDYNSRVSKDARLLDVVGRALSSDILVVLVSPHSVPDRLPRDRWEPLFVEAAREHRTHIAYIAVAECPFPKVLLRSHTFDPAGGSECARALKRWVFHLDPASQHPFFVPPGSTGDVSPARLESLWQALADGPGTAAIADLGLARDFASKAQNDFEGVFWVDCRGATLAGVAGELGAQMGLRLPGDLTANLPSICELGERYRCLVILEGPGPDVADELGSLGRTSLLLVESVSPAMSLETANLNLHALATWMTERIAAPSPGQIRQTMEWLIQQPERWMTACQFARAALGYYKFHDRFAEAFEMVEPMAERALRMRDREAAEEFAGERAWILHSWGRPVGAAHHSVRVGADPAIQLLLW